MYFMCKEICVIYVKKHNKTIEILSGEALSLNWSN